MDEPAPAPRSTRISSPAALSLPSTSGTRATRRSPGAVSLATPTFMGTTLTWAAGAADGVGPRWTRGVGRRIPAGRPLRDRTHRVADEGRWRRAQDAGHSAARFGSVGMGRAGDLVASLPDETTRWLSVLVPVAAVAIIELVSDGLLDASLPFPLDTVVVVIVVAALAWGFSVVAFRRIDRLAAELRARNADLERREASARALHRVSVAIAALADLDEILRVIVGEARERLVGERGDPASCTAPMATVTSPPRVGPKDGIDRAGGYPGADAVRFVRPDLAIARLEAPLQRAGETIGLLMVGSMVERAFEIDEVETLSSLANQAAIAIENARLQARLRELAVVAERERIAREMHDGLAQVLGYVNTKSQAIEELLPLGRIGRGARPAGGAGRGGAVDLRRCPRGDPRAAQSGHARLGLVGAVEDTPTASRRPRRSWSSVDASAGCAPTRSRAGGRGPGLPDRPGGADQRPQARRRAPGRHRLRGRRRTARRRHHG